MRFIIIDDDPANNMLCKFLLKRILPNVEVITFTLPEKALAFILNEIENEIRIETFILLDLNMPILSGWDFLAELKKYQDFLSESFHISILSSSIDLRDRERAMAHVLVESYFEKPLKAEQVEEILIKKKS